MGGTHKFTSSVWIQSGSSPATFQSGISVTGNVSASQFIGDGSGITGIGSAVFFAGSGSGISASSPTSIDHVTELDAADAIAPASYFRIETTSSAGFEPNHFVFIKITDKFETLQSGSQDFYIGEDRTPGGDESGDFPFTNDRAPGVHRYIVYATNTGSAGATHVVYTSAFIDGYVNVAPIIDPPLQSEGVVQIAHDQNSLTHILHFTGSEDPNSSQNDFIRVFSASRLTTDPIINSTQPVYDLSMGHHQSDFVRHPDNLIASGTNDPANPYLAGRGVYGAGTGNTSPLPKSSLAFTASISSYSTINGVVNYSDTMEPHEERFKITMFDNWFVDHSSSLEYSMSIVPPNTASIRNVRARIESGSFSGIPTDTFSTPILYDDTATRTNIEGLHPRYTSSIVRVSVMADITEPADYETDGNHFTTIRINESGHPDNPLKDKRFRFSGSMIGPGLFRATASAHDTSMNFNNNIPTESLGFSPFSYTAGTSTLNVSETDHLQYLQHGNYHHISAMHPGSDTTLTVASVPNIEISNVRVEVESGSFLTGVGAFERSASVLYGFTSSLQVSETSILEGYENSAEYISESVVRLRLLATVTEPFGPHHTNMTASLDTTLGSTHAHSHEFQLHTGSGAIHTASSAIAYDDQNRLVGHYTSSWINFNLLPGEYIFSASFDCNTNAGRTIEVGTNAEVSVSNTPPTEITNIVYETETYGHSETGSTDAMRTVLYGVPRYTLADSSSFDGHVNAVTYASHSVSRFRVLATITEPFGPHHTASRFEKVWTNNSGDGETFNSIIHFSTGSVDTASSAIAYDVQHRLVGNYTSSWIGQQLSSSDDAPKTWTYTSGSIIHTPNDFSGFITASGNSTQLIINDTAQIQISNRFHEFEEYGHSASSAADIGITNTSRTVLYGSNRTTLADSSSFENHPNSASYASQSVSRVRMRTRITEPVGPGHGEIRFIPTLVGDRKTLNAFTNSADFESISHAYDSQKRLVAHYTESWHGVEITGAPTIKTAQFDDNDTTNQLDFASTENGIDKGTPTNADIQVFDTAPTQITNIRYQTETFGYSEEPDTDTTRKVLYGSGHHTNKDSSSYQSHVSASKYASQSITQFRVLATITEPVGPLHTASRFEKVWTANNESTIRNVIHFNTASADTASAVIAYDSSNRLVGHYTSSWIGQQLSSSNFTTGEQWKYTSGSILHEPANENKFTTASGESTTLTVFDTQPTVFSNFKTETETFGYSNEPIQNSERTVLYGHVTTDIDSASYADHVNSGSYASQSIARFRLIGTITEPVGPLQHTASIIEKTFNADVSKTETIIFGTGSSDLINSRSFFTEIGEFVTEYTSSWIGKALAPDTWSISTGSVKHDPYGENSANSSSFEKTTIIVHDTAPTQIDSIVYETETYGHSYIGSTGSMRTVLYGVPRHALADSSSFEGHDSASLYTSHSVSRFRVLATITEPVGPLHTASRFEKVWTNNSGDGETFNSTIHFNSGSVDTASSAIAYDSSNRLVGNYTSSWIGQQLSSSDDAPKTWTYTSGSILHEPVGENKFTTASGDSTQLVINDTAKVKIEDIFWETETYGYSDENISNSERTVLYGNNHVTDIDSASYADHANSGSYASQSVSRVRFRARVTEPIGPAVNKLRAEFTYGTTTTNFEIQTGSIENGGTSSSLYIDNKLVAFYTSSFIGREFDTIAGDQKTHNLTGKFIELTSGENGLIQEDETNGSIIVHDTVPTQIDSIVYETETFGYSEIETRDSDRTILYGDRHVTNRTSQSLSWTSHDSASLYASQSVSRFRVRARVIEPAGPLHTASRFEKVWSTLNETTITDVIHFNTGSIDTASAVIAYDSSNRLVGHYTSSWIGQQLSSSIYHTTDPNLPSGEIYTYTSGSISHEPVGENKFTTASGDSTTITVFDTQPTQFDSIVFATETFGYSGELATSGERKVLYGVPHHTIEDTSSLYWKNHDSASLYASQSVTRFQVFAKIIEPVGPLHTGSILRQQFTSTTNGIENIASNINAIASITNNQPVQAGNLLNAFNLTNANGYEAGTNEIIRIVFNQPQLVSRINIDSDPNISEFSDIKVMASPDNGVTYFEQENIINNIITPERAFSDFKIEFKNTNDEIVINQIQFQKPIYIEPIIYNDTEFILNSDSTIIESSKSFYDEQSRLVSQYTTSYFGVQLSSSNNIEGEEWQYTISEIIHTPSDESLIIQPTAPVMTTMRVYDTKAPQYDNATVQTETFGYSNTVTTDAMRTVLYGNSQVTDIDSASYESHPSASIYASHSVSRFKMHVKITEPVGPLIHTASNAEMQIYTSDQLASSSPGIIRPIIFGTGSDNLVRSYWTPVGEFVAEYSTSFISQSLSSGDIETEYPVITIGQYPEHQYLGENAPNVTDRTSTAMLVRNTAPTQIDSIAYETETYGYSETGSIETSRKVLYGINDITLGDSSSFEGHVNAAAYASHSVSRFRVRARVIEPVGPLHTASRFDQIWFVSLAGADLGTVATNTLFFSTSSTNIISKSYSDEYSQLVVEYTSSFSGLELVTNTSPLAELNYTYTSGSISHEPVGENSFTTASGHSSTISVINTAKTQIRNLRVETETVGHSNVGVQNTIESNAYAVSRSILYGETASFANSSSFENLNPIFAESSVTRFRVLADIIEPIGPHHISSSIAYTKANSGNLTIGEGTSDFIIFSTASTQTASSAIAYNTSTKELEASYTSSWFGESLSPSKVLTDGIWHINIDTNNNVLHTPLHWPDNSGVDIDTAANDLYMVVSASKPLEVLIKFNAETFYSSSVDEAIRADNILYGFNRTLSASDANTIGDIWSGSAAVRLRPYVKITEPLGFRHFTTDVTMSTTNTSDGEKSRAYKFHTASLETSSRSERVLNSEGRHVTSYTGSYHDGFTFAEGNYTFIPSGPKTGSDVTGIYMDTDGINAGATGTTTIIIQETPKTQITNVRIEAETFSGSAVGTDSRTTTILHGNTVTETDKAANVGYPNETARRQLTSVRLLADIAEPFGPHHTASKFTIGGYNGSHVVTLHTGSADVATKSQQMYDTHGSASVAYTSSFVPLQLTAGTKDLAINVFEHMFEDDNKTTDEGTHADITVIGALPATVTVNPQTGSNNWSSSADLTHGTNFIAYNKQGDITVEIISGIAATAPTETSESVLTFPQHLNILYTESDSELSFSPVTGNSSNEETASLTISDTSMDDFTEVKEFTINVSGSDILPGNGSSGNSSLTFSVIPAKPQNMDGKYWSTSGIGNHGATGIAASEPGINVPSVDNETTRLYTGTLSEGLGNYDDDPNQTPGTVANNIMMAKDSATGTANYSMSFTPFDASNTGNYGANSLLRLFDFGDRGSLQVQVNGDTVVNYSLASPNFRTNDAAGAQNIYDNYVGNGTASFAGITYADKGRLIVTRVEPFNNTGNQSFTNQGVHYPNGYQGWSARIELDDKLREGYNKLEFSHVFDDGTSQTWTPFEWYYDDNVNLATTRANATASITNSPDLFSLSGVSFFKPNVDIDLLFEDAFSNIAGQTYRDLDDTVLETTLGTGIEIEGSSAPINHDLNSNPNGLHFGEEVVNVTPAYNIDTGTAQSASLKIENLQATSVTNAETGENKTLTFKHFNRNYSAADSFTKDGSGTSLSVGRFATEPTTTSTNLTENFFNETYRYNKDTMENNRNTVQADGYWINTANADYDSDQNILNTQDLQVHYTGELRYPQNEYPSHLPNVADYRTATGDRYYYRAFDLGSGTSTHRSIKITLFYDPSNALQLTDFTAGEEIILNGNEDTIHTPSTVDFDATPIRVDICLPGPLPSGAANTNNNPGTKWGCVTALTTEGNPSTVTSLDDWNSLSIDDGKYTILEENQTGGEDIFGSNHTAPDNAFTILMGMGSINTKFSKGIVLCRVRFKDSATNVRQKLTGLKIEPI